MSLNVSLISWSKLEIIRCWVKKRGTAPVATSNGYFGSIPQERVQYNKTTLEKYFVSEISR